MKLPTLDQLASLAVIGAVGLFAWTTLVPSRPTRPEPPERVVALSGTLDISTAQAIGDGPLVLVEFTDYECPFCARHDQQTFPRIKEEYIDTGRLRYVAMHTPIERLHPNARARAAAATCAADRIWELRAQLYAGPPDLEVLGVDPACVAAADTQAAIDQHMQIAQGLASEVGAEALGTPSFVLGTARADGAIDMVSLIRGALPFEQFASALSAVERGKE